MVKIAGLDPGKQKDSFAMVGVESEEDKIYVKLAKKWHGINYLKVEDEITELHKKINFDNIIVEYNNTGSHVYEVLAYQKNLPVIAVTTVAELKDKKTPKSIHKMEKNLMVKYMLHLFQEGKIIFPIKSNPDIDELKRQLAIFAEVKTEAGNVSYRAEGQEHDDYVMALMLAVHFTKFTVYNSISLTKDNRIIGFVRPKNTGIKIVHEYQ